MFKVDFAAMEWQEGRPGVRYKVHAEGGRRAGCSRPVTVSSSRRERPAPTAA
jgi:hypothetical protein